MKTSLQQLIDFLEPELKMHDFSQLPAYEKAKDLLETEKKQIIDAYKSGIENEYNGSDMYYSETFKN